MVVAMALVVVGIKSPGKPIDFSYMACLFVDVTRNSPDCQFVLTLEKATNCNGQDENVSGHVLT